MLMLLEFRHWITIMITIANFSICQLYVKDKNHINYLALTIGFHYVMKQVEAVMINGFKVG